MSQEEDVYHTVDDDEALSVDLTTGPLSQCPDQRPAHLPLTSYLTMNRHISKGKCVAGNDAQWVLGASQQEFHRILHPPELLLSKYSLLND